MGPREIKSKHFIVMETKKTTLAFKHWNSLDISKAKQNLSSKKIMVMQIVTNPKKLFSSYVDAM
jgi:hypothetical protein